MALCVSASQKDDDRFCSHPVCWHSNLSFLCHLTVAQLLLVLAWLGGYIVASTPAYVGISLVTLIAVAAFCYAVLLINADAPRITIINPDSPRIDLAWSGPTIVAVVVPLLAVIGVVAMFVAFFVIAFRTIAHGEDF